MKKSAIILLAAITSITAGCATTSAPESEAPAPVTEEQKALFQQSLTTARAAHQQSMDVGFAWRDTGEMIEKAEEAAAKGDINTAQQLVETAKRHAELAIEQAEREKNAAPRY